MNNVKKALTTACLANFLIFSRAHTMNFKSNNRKTSSQEIVLTTDKQSALNEQLVTAAITGNIDAIQPLIDHGAQVNAISDYGNMALHEAIGDNNLPLVRILLNAQADVNKIDGHDLRPLSYIGSMFMDTYTKPSNSLLTETALIDTLLYAKAHVDFQHCDGDTILHRAVTCLPISQNLIRAGACLTQPNKKGKTPLDLVDSSTHAQMLATGEEKIISEHTIAMLLSGTDAAFHGLPLPQSLLQLIAEYATAQFSALDIARFNREQAFTITENN